MNEPAGRGLGLWGLKGVGARNGMLNKGRRGVRVLTGVAAAGYRAGTLAVTSGRSEMIGLWVDDGLLVAAV